MLPPPPSIAQRGRSAPAAAADDRGRRQCFTAAYMGREYECRKEREKGGGGERERPSLPPSPMKEEKAVSAAAAARVRIARLSLSHESKLSISEGGKRRGASVSVREATAFPLSLPSLRVESGVRLRERERERELVVVGLCVRLLLLFLRRRRRGRRAKCSFPSLSLSPSSLSLSPCTLLASTGGGSSVLSARASAVWCCRWVKAKRIQRKEEREAVSIVLRQIEFMSVFPKVGEQKLSLLLRRGLLFVPVLPPRIQLPRSLPFLLLPPPSFSPHSLPRKSAPI